MELENFEEKKGYVIAKYHVYTDPGAIAWGLNWIVDILTEKSLPRVIEALRERVLQIYYNQDKNQI